jgi:post-segregation antitoxin (ccd killing protein)
MDSGTETMRATVILDDQLVSDAKTLTCLSDISALANAALKALIERETVRRLAALGGHDPDADPPERRRPPAAC